MRRFVNSRFAQGYSVGIERSLHEQPFLRLCLYAHCIRQPACGRATGIRFVSTRFCYAWPRKPFVVSPFVFGQSLSYCQQIGLCGASSIKARCARSLFFLFSLPSKPTFFPSHSLQTTTTQSKHAFRCYSYCRPSQHSWPSRWHWHSLHRLAQHSRPTRRYRHSLHRLSQHSWPSRRHRHSLRRLQKHTRPPRRHWHSLRHRLKGLHSVSFV